MKSEGTQPPVQPTPNHITEELNKMHRLRNLPQPGPNFHGPVHGGGFSDFHSGDKNQRLDARSPGIPPGSVRLGFVPDFVDFTILVVFMKFILENSANNFAEFI